MAVRHRIETSVGMIPEPQDILTDSEGKLTESSVAALSAFMKTVTQAINGRLSFGDGRQSAQTGNFDGQFIEWTFVVANQEYEIPHGLGRVPQGIIVTMMNGGGNIFASNRGGWGTDRLFLKSNNAPRTARLIVF